MKILLLLLILSSAAYAYDPLSGSPYNIDNNMYNPENSSLNPENSPLNPENSTLNPYSERIIRDPNGNPTGYAVPKDNGGVNFFDNNGNRTGYLPGN